ncbi:MAG TPA: bifunctional diaminohydroxyphosphoribosylaminopyrimidine deaminase/5-amino-6-(5-phosphoribosylamino)uracil reductase RibD, partial [Cyanobacteria bacterium UBA9579]|nr:bifunctional diaminohydroxyphosphoribosylaminopyrimidine deaminase/5-amino-6-(5-phosphoribosylamino)uracil reductase RibD [Cyanobacteria bacterium UBA9579]
MTFEQDKKYMQHCIDLAKLGEGYVSPNPLVGAVVLDKNAQVVGTGYHKKYGEAHAEVNALNDAGELAKGGTLYINLEPCSHFGKTPPCVNKVIESGIKRLVIGMVDPNPLVAGEGIRRAKEAGIEVTIGILEKECKKLNEIFIKHVTQKQPFIAIKTASTIDGKIATKTGSSKWITSDLARLEVQGLRKKYDAILTGSGTVIADNPSLTCRIPGGRNPV